MQAKTARSRRRSARRACQPHQRDWWRCDRHPVLEARLDRVQKDRSSRRSIWSRTEEKRAKKFASPTPLKVKCGRVPLPPLEAANDRKVLVSYLEEPSLLSSSTQADHPDDDTSYPGFINRFDTNAPSSAREGDWAMPTLDLQEAARCLRIHPEELRQRAKKGAIPGAKVGRCWVFVEDDLVHISARSMLLLGKRCK